MSHNIIHSFPSCEGSTSFAGNKRPQKTAQSINEQTPMHFHHFSQMVSDHHHFRKKLGSITNIFAFHHAIFTQVIIQNAIFSLFSRPKAQVGATCQRSSRIGADFIGSSAGHDAIFSQAESGGRPHMQPTSQRKQRYPIVYSVAFIGNRTN